MITMATLVFGGFVAAGLWIAQRLPRFGFWRFAIVLILAAAGLLLFSTVSHEHFLGDQRWYNRPVWKGCFECLLMIFGMLASVVNTAIKARQSAKANLGGTAPSPLQIDRYDLVQPLLFSLLTFAA